MKERQILFSGTMVRALLDGSKTQTRRPVKFPRSPDHMGQWEPADIGGDGVFTEKGEPAPPMRAIWHTRTGVTLTCPYGQPGDRLWVRETWAPNAGTAGGFLYRADYGNASSFHAVDLRAGEWTHQVERWRPSIHMPRPASRILLEITSVRVERLQDIREPDAIAEGVLSLRSREWDLKHFRAWRDKFDDACDRADKPPIGPLPSESYRALWESLTGADSWNANPWVWVIEFKRVIT